MRKILIPLLLLLVFLSACVKEEEPEIIIDDSFNVDFITYYGHSIDSIKFTQPGLLTLPEGPSREGYIFKGWFTKDYRELIEGDLLVSEDTVIRAYYEPINVYVHFYWDERYLGKLEATYDRDLIFPVLTVSGHYFLGWYTEKELKHKLDAAINILEPIDVYAKLQLPKVIVPMEGIIKKTSLPYYSFTKISNPEIVIEFRNIGSVELQLFPQVARFPVDYMLHYIKSNQYKDNTFHITQNGINIQGVMEGLETCQPFYEFTYNNEVDDVSQFRGSISMLKATTDEAILNSFYVNSRDNLFLDAELVTFGGVIKGFNVLDYIYNQVLIPDTNQPYRDIVVESITINLNGYRPRTIECE